MSLIAWRYSLVTGSTGDITLTFQAATLRTVRVAGTAALAGAVAIKDGSTTVETLASTTAVGVERNYEAYFSGGLKINLSNAADVILVIWLPSA